MLPIHHAVRIRVCMAIAFIMMAVVMVVLGNATTHTPKPLPVHRMEMRFMDEQGNYVSPNYTPAP